MAPEAKPDYVERLEKALFEYVEKFGPTESVRRLFRDREKKPSVGANFRQRLKFAEPKE